MDETEEMARESSVLTWISAIVIVFPTAERCFKVASEFAACRWTLSAHAAALLLEVWTQATRPSPEPDSPSLWLAAGLAPVRLVILVTVANSWRKWLVKTAVRKHYFKHYTKFLLLQRQNSLEPVGCRAPRKSQGQHSLFTVKFAGESVFFSFTGRYPWLRHVWCLNLPDLIKSHVENG